MTRAGDERIGFVHCPYLGCHVYWSDKFNPGGWTPEERDRLLAAHDRLAHAHD